MLWTSPRGWVTFAAIQRRGATPPFFWCIVPVAARSFHYAMGARMSPETLAWQFIDPTGEGLPEHLEAALDAGDSTVGCVVFWVTPGIDRHWGADVSLLVARGWASRGRSIFLADASFEDPVFHESIAGVSNEGLSDVMLYGASVKRIARPVDGGVLVASAGTPVGDAAEVLAHPKWDTVIRGFEEAGAVLLVHVSAATTGAEALLDRAAGIILVSEETANVETMLGSASDRVIAVIGPETVGELDTEPVALSSSELETDGTPASESELVSTPESEFEPAGVLEEEPKQKLEEEPEQEVEMVPEMDDERELESEPEAESEPAVEAEPTLEVEATLEVESESQSGSEAPVEADAAPAAVTEDDGDDGELFSMEELPESTGNAADQVDDSSAFSFDGMAGSQYDSSGEAEAEAEAEVEVEAELEASLAEEVEDVGVEAADLESEAADMEPLEVEPPEVSSPEADDPGEEVPSAQAAPSEEEGIPDEERMVEGVTRSAIEMDDAAVAAAAEDAHLDMDGFETGAGFDLEDAPDDGDVDLVGDEAALGGESEGSDDFGFGDGGLEVEASPFAEDDPSEEDEVAAPAASLDGAEGDEVFGDPGSDALEPGAPDSGEDVSTTEAEDESIAVDSATEAMGAAMSAPPSEDTAPEVDIEMDEGPPARMSGLEELERRRKRGARIRHFLVAVATALIVGGGGVGVAYFGLVNIPGITPPERVRSSVPAPVEPPGPTPVTPVISHVLLVDAWRTMETALSTVEALHERLPEHLFFVTFMETDGGDQYALLAGPAFNAVEADALKEPLSQVLDRLDPATWVVQEARYSFFFGEYTEAADAAGRVESLTALSIPTHVLQVDYPDGATGLRVYGGAFVDEFQAAAMGRLLRANELGDVRLTERRGRIPE